MLLTLAEVEAEIAGMDLRARGADMAGPSTDRRGAIDRRSLMPWRCFAEPKNGKALE